jgi:hypothetical protein
MRPEDDAEYHWLLLENGRRWWAAQLWRWRHYVVNPARTLLASGGNY